MNPRTVVVTNLATLEEFVYTNSLPVEKNVRNAYFQAKGDYNWWDYDNRQCPPIEQGNDVVVCGDWCAFVDGHRFQAKSSR